MSISRKPYASSPDAVLEMRGVSKSFPGGDVLRNVDFDVCRGQVHVLLGENGAGKSTLMNILAQIGCSWRQQDRDVRHTAEGQRGWNDRGC